MSLQDKPRIKTKQMVKRWNAYAEKDPLWIILTHPDKRDGKWDTDEFFQTGRNDIARIMDWIKDEGIEYSKERALDFGCGVGRLTQALCDHFDSCHGVDISEQMIAQSREYNKHGDRCVYHVNEAEDLAQFESNHFSFVFTAIVLQHIHPEYSKKYLCEFMRILKPGGKLVFQLPVHRIDRSPESVTPAPAEAVGGGLKKSLGKIYYGLKGSVVEIKARLRSAKRFASGEMDVEMHGLSKEELVDLLAPCGGVLLADQSDDEIANGWRSNWYVFEKKN